MSTLPKVSDPSARHSNDTTVLAHRVPAEVAVLITGRSWIAEEDGAGRGLEGRRSRGTSSRGDRNQPRFAARGGTSSAAGLQGAHNQVDPHVTRYFSHLRVGRRGAQTHSRRSERYAVFLTRNRILDNRQTSASSTSRSPLRQNRRRRPVLSTRKSGPCSPRVGATGRSAPFT